MKVIISPSKEKSFKAYDYTTSNPIYLRKTKSLVKKLKLLNISEIQKSYKCSLKIAEKVYYDFNHFGEITHPAISYFNGIQYKYLSVETLKNDEIDFLIKNLYIADSLYGILRANDLISEYRLDYHTKLPFYNYDYYKKEINEVIDEKIINLCSKEYSKNIDNNKLFNIEFVQNKKGIIKSYSTETKIARGVFIRYIAQRKSLDIENLKQFKLNGYSLIVNDEKGLKFLKKD